MKKSVEMRKALATLKATIEALQKEGKTSEAHAKLAELRALKEEIEVQEELENTDLTDAQNKGTGHQGQGQAVNAMVVFNKQVLGKPLSEEERQFVNAAGSPGQVESVDDRGGFLVPVEQFTQIKEWKRQRNPLKQFCNIISVNSKTGTMPLEVDANDELTNFEELTEIAQSEIKFGQLKYDVVDYGDIIPVSNTLLSDEKANLISYIGKRFARKAVRSENKKIVESLKLLTAKPITDYSGITTTLNIALDPAISDNSVVLTNQNGFDYLDSLVDGNGRPILTESLADKTKKLFKGREVVVLTNGELPNTGAKIPIYVGDMGEYVTFFDREGVSVAVSTEAGFTKNATLLRVIERFDVKVVDKDAMVRLDLTVPAP